ncbi:MAG: NADH-quinone oxidoreductase subunit N [Deltaproteobacteria bacterium]|nr:NADH-quinone oxidoreductase subunit N [Deltaproteobacteria bacterium]
MGLTDIHLFIPELFVLLTALVFFSQSLWRSPAAVNHRLAVGLSFLSVVICLLSLNQSGDLFFRAYRVDLFSQGFKVLISLGLFLVILLSRELKSVEDHLHPEYYMFLCLSSLGLMLMVSSVELVTIFVSMELSSYSVYILIPLRKRTYKNQMEAAIKYIIFGAASTGVMLFGMSYLFGIAQTTYVADLIHKLPQLMSQPVGVAGLTMVLAGFFFKLAVVPFHFWTPDIYQGAANETTSFIATLPKLAGLALLLRLVSLGGPQATDLVRILVFLAAVSMTLGNLVALVQKDVKRLLAYSSVAHAGYILLGVLTLNAVGYAAAVYHITAYLLMNLACFLVICLVSREGEDVSIADLSGLYRRSPLLAFTLAVGAFALAGIPPTAGFTGKLFLFTAALNQGHLALVVLAAVNTAVSIFFYLNLVRAAYGQDPADRPVIAVPRSSQVLNVGLILAILLLGVVPAWFIDLARTACERLIF